MFVQFLPHRSQPIREAHAMTSASDTHAALLSFLSADNRQDAV